MIDEEPVEPSTHEPPTERPSLAVAQRIVASGGDPLEFVDRFTDRIAHVHIRDAVPGNINLSVGRGSVNFASGLKALANAGYDGHFAFELETRDITDDQRPAATAAAAHLISNLI